MIWMRSSLKLGTSITDSHYIYIRQRKEFENNLQDGGISASFPAIWGFGWKKKTELEV